MPSYVAVVGALILRNPNGICLIGPQLRSALHREVGRVASGRKNFVAARGIRGKTATDDFRKHRRPATKQAAQAAGNLLAFSNS
jgi:hypothetical protein